MAKKQKKTEDIELCDEKLLELTFETALERLETIVRQLEMDTLSLDDALALFQEGVSLSRFTQQKLGEAEAKIDLLINGKDGKLELQPVKKQFE